MQRIFRSATKLDRRTRIEFFYASRTTPKPTMHLAPGTTISGKYVLERKIASGGQGSVWVGRHMQLHAEVAIKFLDLGHSDEDGLARVRFEREARAAAGIRHPHLVHVQDIGDHEGIPYLVMEFFQGESLDKRLKTLRAPLDVAAVANLLQPIAKGLRRLHEAGFVHRDIKPSNIFLAKNDEGEEVVKILDFGIVKQLGSDLVSGTQTGEFVGSPAYMSPEQLRASKNPDIRSDIWSVAVILYQALTRSRPFEGDGVSNVIVSVMTGIFMPPSKKNPSLSPTVDAFFAKALNRDINTRFQTMKDMTDAFLELLSGPPSRAPTPPPAIAMLPPHHPAVPNSLVEDEPSDLMATIPLQQARMAVLNRPIGGTQKLPSPHEVEAYIARRPEAMTPAPATSAPGSPAPQPSYPNYPTMGYAARASMPSIPDQGSYTPPPPPSYPYHPPSSRTAPIEAQDRPTPIKPVKNQWLVKGLLMGMGIGLILVVLLLFMLR